jgi:formylglycine-generating enzyme required for sulfatase activity
VREPVTPRGRYEAVGKEGKLAAIASGALAVLVMLGVFVGIFVFLFTAARPDDDAPKPAEKRVQAAPPAAAKAPQADAAKTGATTADCVDCPPLVTVQPGVFMMGLRPEESEADDVPAMQQQAELPVRGVTVSQPFAMGQTEVTRGQFAVFANETGFQSLGCLVNNGKTWVIDRTKSWRDPGFSQDDEHPVVCVNEGDAIAYADWLSRKTGKRYRLPSEAEWEYVARAGLASGKPWGDKPALACAHAKVADRSHAARFSSKTAEMFFPCETGYAFTAPVAHYQANGFGLFDLYGNVREYVGDCWSPTYLDRGPSTAARTDGDCQTAVLRGGGWFDAPSNIRPSRRFRESRDLRRADQGFRVVKELPVTVN